MSQGDLLQILAIRPMEQEDLEFVVDSWLKSNIHSDWAKRLGAKSDWNEPIQDKRSFESMIAESRYYMTTHRLLIIDIINRFPVLIASMKKDKADLCGFACYGDGVVHYAYIKKPFRGFGLFKMMLHSLEDGGLPVLYSHETYRIKRYRLPKHWIHVEQSAYLSKDAIQELRERYGKAA